MGVGVGVWVGVGVRVGDGVSDGVAVGDGVCVFVGVIRPGNGDGVDGSTVEAIVGVDSVGRTPGGGVGRISPTGGALQTYR
jgi:hypothetical protein